MGSLAERQWMFQELRFSEMFDSQKVEVHR